MQKTLLILLTLLAPLAVSAGAPEDVLTCNGTMVNPDHDIWQDVDLVPQEYDTQYLEGKIGDHVFGALAHDIAKNEAILLVTDPAVKRTALLTASFSKIAGTNVRYVSQKYVIDLGDGTQTWLAASCYLAPPGEGKQVRALMAQQRWELGILKRRK